MSGVREWHKALAQGTSSSRCLHECLRTDGRTDARTDVVVKLRRDTSLSYARTSGRPDFA